MYNVTPVGAVTNVPVDAVTTVQAVTIRAVDTVTTVSALATQAANLCRYIQNDRLIIVTCEYMRFSSVESHQSAAFAATVQSPVCSGSQRSGKCKRMHIESHLASR